MAIAWMQLVRCMKTQLCPTTPVPAELKDLYRMNRLAPTHEEELRVRKIWDEMFSRQVDQPGVHELMRSCGMWWMNMKIACW
jgi:hypothetical protein